MSAETVLPPPDAGAPPIDARIQQAGNRTTNAAELETQINAGYIASLTYFGTSSGPPPAPEPPVDLPKHLPPGVHAYRDPDHATLIDLLRKNRILMLTSYGEDAAYAAAHMLLNDEWFRGKRQRALSPTSRRDKERPDLELLTLTNDAFLSKDALLLIEVRHQCTFLDSILESEHVSMSRVCQMLEDNQSYLVLSVDERLVSDDSVKAKLQAIECRSVSHVRYLLTRTYGERAGEYEKRLAAAPSLAAVLATKPDEYYHRIAHALRTNTFEALLAELASAPEVLPQKPRTVDVDAIFKTDPELRRAVVFVATHLPDLNQLDFDRFIRLLLADQSISEERVHQTIRPDGKLRTIRERKKTLLVEQWSREGDRVFRDCGLHTVTTGDGSRIIEFTEPGLRDDLRNHLVEYHPWYFRQQCQRLQDSGVLFASGLGPKAIEGLVQLFVERAIADPSDFDSVWLLQLALSARALFNEAAASADATSDWLSLAQAHHRRIFHERLTALIREMLQHTVLRNVVDEFFNHLVDTNQHEALLNVVLDLAPRLRFFPQFDPLIWMRKLLDHGKPSVRKRTAETLVELVHGSGPRIYELLAKVHKWLEDGEPEDRFSSYLARDFPFWYCAGAAQYVEPGVWPSQHPLFYALSNDSDERRSQLASLVEWVLDKHDRKDASHTPNADRSSHVASLLEHWAFVLEGASDQGPEGGQGLFDEIAKEVESRISPLERTWLQRAWQRQQDELNAPAEPLKSAAERKLAGARRKKLEKLRVRFANPIKPCDI